MRKYWTQEKIEILKKEYANKNSKELAEELDVSVCSLHCKAYKLKLKKSQTFIQTLNKNYSDRMKVNNPMNDLKIREKMKNTLKLRYSTGAIISSNKNKRLKYVTERNIINNPMFDLKVKKRMQNTLVEGYSSGRLKKWQLGKTKDTNKSLKKISDKLKERQLSNEHIENICKNHWTKKDSKAATLNKILKSRSAKIDEINKNISNSIKKLWQQDTCIYNTKKFRQNISDRTRLEKNPMWLGGLSFEPYTPDFNTEFKNLVKLRDNFCCLNCGISEQKNIIITNKKLVIHHIDYDKKNTCLYNCCSLCNRCNILANKNRDEWRVYYQNKLNKLYNYVYKNNYDVLINTQHEK